VATARGKGAGKAKRPALPPPDGDAPLHELTRDELSVFLYAALLPEENLRIVRDLGLRVPGFRNEALSEPERCDLIADEIRAVPEERSRVLEALRAGFAAPPLLGLPLDARAARDLVDVGTTEHGTVLALWRLLADPDPELRALAKPLLARMVADYYGPAPEGEAGAAPAEGSAERPASPAPDRSELKRAAAKAKEELERERRRGEERAEKLQGQLKEARAAESQALAEGARAREAADAARRSLERVEAEFASAQRTDAAVELKRARQELRELSTRMEGEEARAGRAERRARELEEELDGLRRAATSSHAAAPVPVAGTGDEEGDEVPAAWLLPVYSREFYDSLDGWERRIQRAAFKQAHLLAQDHRHPSLRALPLEGLPGYYRVRVATDVRLIYRRGEDERSVEILSLIDREDLDRYVRQAKTRG
jgi:mRNA-degrading endonuclease RelE of RelBE toxin-antitoxin system